MRGRKPSCDAKGGRVPALALQGKENEDMDATWFPVSLYELRYDRKWSDDDIRSLCRSGRLGVVRPKDKRHGEIVFFESIEDRFRYLRLRKHKWEAYERKERELARVAGIPYGGQSWSELENPNPDYMPRPKVEPKKDDFFHSDGWNVVVMIFKTMWIILQVLMLPFAIIGMRDGVQWFLGTGEYGKGRDDFA